MPPTVVLDPVHLLERGLDLVVQLGFDPVETGPIEQSWLQQPGTSVHGKNYDTAKIRTALA